jgi:hypothetical protein
MICVAYLTLCRAQGHRLHAGAHRAEPRRPAGAAAADRRRHEADDFKEIIVPTGPARGLFFIGPMLAIARRWPPGR